MIAGAISTQNKKRIVCFIEQQQLQEIEQQAQQEGVSRSAIIRGKLNRK